MPDQYALAQPAPARRRFQRALKRAGIAALFSIVLIIPALRRLRRRVWIWTAFRTAAVAAGGWLASRFVYSTGGAGILALGLALIVFGLVFRARPETRSVDSVACELHALVVVNGGAFVSGKGENRVSHVNLFVNSDRILALGGLRRPLVEIPFARVRGLSAHPSSQDTERSGGAWNLDITWQSSTLITTRFSYQGAFAEHLAHVAETTLRNLWKKELPILRV